MTKRGNKGSPKFPLSGQVEVNVLCTDTHGPRPEYHTSVKRSYSSIKFRQTDLEMVTPIRTVQTPGSLRNAFSQFSSTCKRQTLQPTLVRFSQPVWWWWARALAIHVWHGGRCGQKCISKSVPVLLVRASSGRAVNLGVLLQRVKIFLPRTAINRTMLLACVL